jgi:UDP-glucose 4-epimerase
MKLNLVTGGAGFIGSHIAEALVSRGERVRILDNFSTGFAANLADIEDRIEIHEGDITDPATVARAVAGVDCIFHHAALASVPRSIEDPLASHHACATGTVLVLDAARRAGVRRVVYAASSSAYGDQPFSSKREGDLLDPLSPYAAAKLSGEMYCKAFYKAYGLQTVGLRYFNVFGPRQDPKSPYSAVIPIFISKLLEGASPRIYGDGEQTRDFVYVANVVHANLLASAADRAPGHVVNIGNGRSISLNALFGKLQRITGRDIPAIYDPPRAGDVRDSLADIVMAQTLLGYEPIIDFDAGLMRTVAYFERGNAKGNAPRSAGSSLAPQQ